MSIKTATTATPARDDLSNHETTFSILVVEDDDEFRESCVRWLRHKGYEVHGAGGGADAISQLQTRQHDVGLFDMDMPGMSGLELLQRLRDDSHEIEVVMLTGQGSIETAVQAMKLGASDFLTKPCPLADLELHLKLAFQRGQINKENKQLREIISRSKPKPKLIGKSPAMQSVVHMVERIAATSEPVLITGESGTGKEIVAQSVHIQSDRANKPIVTINCAALPETLVESELFGHQKGSFTGATEEKPGLFEVADGGTLFIDEFGELPPALQPKMLRVLEDGSLRRVGSSQERRVNVRVIAATNRDLAADVANGLFRQDLYYRVNVLPIHLPPLRERGSDVDLLIKHFLPPEWSIGDDTLATMVGYAWPGNVRELINVIQRATILAEHHEITIDDLPDEIVHPIDRSRASHATAVVTPHEESLDDLTRTHVMETLEQENGNKSRAAKRLGIHRRKLYRLLERWGSDSEQS